MKPEPSQGFADLIERGHPELTFEAVVLRHPKTFSDDIQAAARNRLQTAGLNPDAYAYAPEGA